MATEVLKYRGAQLATKLIAGGLVALASGIGSYIALDNFGSELLGAQEIPIKIIEAAGVGAWAGLSVVSILADARISLRHDLRRTGPLKQIVS